MVTAQKNPFNLDAEVEHQKTMNTHSVTLLSFELFMTSCWKLHLHFFAKIYHHKDGPSVICPVYLYTSGRFRYHCVSEHSQWKEKEPTFAGLSIRADLISRLTVTSRPSWGDRTVVLTTHERADGYKLWGWKEDGERQLCGDCKQQEQRRKLFVIVFLVLLLLLVHRWFWWEEYNNEPPQDSIILPENIYNMAEGYLDQTLPMLLSHTFLGIFTTQPKHINTWCKAESFNCVARTRLPTARFIKQ